MDRPELMLVFAEWQLQSRGPESRSLPASVSPDAVGQLKNCEPRSFPSSSPTPKPMPERSAFEGRARVPATPKKPRRDTRPTYCLENASETGLAVRSSCTRTRMFSEPDNP